MNRFSPVTPVLDVSDLSRVAALPDLEMEEGEDVFANPLTPQASEDRASANRARDRRKYREWLAAARRLAAAGVHVSPSHYQVDGNWYTTTWGAFYDERDLRKHLASTGAPFREQEPLVLLGFEVSAVDPELVWLPPRGDWYAVATQTAGMICHHRYFVGVPLPLHDAGARLAYQVASFAERGGHSCVGLGSLTLSELADYHAFLTSQGLSADRVWERLEEGCYPLDVSCGEMFTDSDIPKSSDLMEPEEMEPEEMEPEEDPTCSADGVGVDGVGVDGVGVDGVGVGSLVRTRQDALARLQLHWSRWDNLKRWAIYVLGENCD
jgi:hypothetical protein